MGKTFMAIGFGIALGAGLGAAFHNVAIGVAMGAALGAGVWGMLLAAGRSPDA